MTLYIDIKFRTSYQTEDQIKTKNKTTYKRIKLQTTSNITKGGYIKFLSKNQNEATGITKRQ